MKTAIVFAGGDPPPADVTEALPARALVIAADSGFDHARTLGIEVDLLVGDLDSISSEGLAAADHIAVERHLPDKDASDLTLAMRAAASRGAERVVVVGGGGGRFDHLLTNSAVLTSNEFASLRIEWLVENAKAFVVRSQIEIEGHAGDLVTLLAQDGNAEGVNTTGLRWPLRVEMLEHGSSRGLSNEMISNKATVAVRSGVLLVIVSRR